MVNSVIFIDKLDAPFTSKFVLYIKMGWWRQLISSPIFYNGFLEAI